MVRVSIIIPTYGEPIFLDQSIKSVLRQSFGDFELIIVDDNNPGTEARKMTEKVVANNPSPKIVYIKHERNLNGAVARNTGLARAKGEYIAFLDSDDEYMPNRLEKCIEAMDGTPTSVAGVYTGCEFRRNGKVYNRYTSVTSGNFLKETLACRFMFCSGSNIFVRKSVIDELNGFDESFLRHQDYEFLVRLFLKYTLTSIPRLLIVKNNENFNMPNVGKQISIKEQYLDKFRKNISEMSDKDQSYIYHCNYVTIAENAMRQRRYKLAWIFYRKATHYKPLTLNEVMRLTAFLTFSLVRR